MTYIDKLENEKYSSDHRLQDAVWDEIVAVVRAAEFVRHASDCAQVSWAHLVLDGQRHEDKPTCTCWRHDVEIALDALKAKVESAVTQKEERQ